jgi:deoxyribodipyrimidine photo-lyase
MLNLHWFRNDLRIQDNLSLIKATATGQTIALFIATPEQWQAQDDAPMKIDFIRRNLQVLQQELSLKNIPLLFAEVSNNAGIPELLEKIISVLGISALHCNREYPEWEAQRDNAVNLMCKKLKVAFFCHEDQTLLPPEQVYNKSNLPFKVFTPYSKAVRAQLEEKPVHLESFSSKQTMPELPALSSKTKKSDSSVFLRQVCDLSWPNISADLLKKWSLLWPAGEEHAWLMLRNFVQNRINQYKPLRDQPAVDGTSRLSPYLTVGVISARQCWVHSMNAELDNSVFAWQNELLWRDFYKYVMVHFQHVCRHKNWRTDLGHIPWRDAPEDLERWKYGQTGIPIVDAAMKQLLETGWMHNRVRMIVAMFLSKHLLIDWREGEKWFMQHLVDGDFSSNNGGWQWSASTGTDAAPYFRIFNPVTQSGRFDPEGVYLRRWLPELAELDNKFIHEPGLLRPSSYPPPMLELSLGRDRALAAFKVPSEMYPSDKGTYRPQEKVI